MSGFIIEQSFEINELAIVLVIVVTLTAKRNESTEDHVDIEEAVGHSGMVWVLEALSHPFFPLKDDCGYA